MSDGALSQETIDALLRGELPGDKKEESSGEEHEEKKHTTEVLSEDEIDQLLIAMNNGDVPDGFKTDGNGDYEPTTRPEIFSKDQRSAISLIYEKFAAFAANKLSERLNIPVNIEVASCDQLYHEEFLRSVPSPGVMGIFNMEPLKGSAILEIDPLIAFAIIDRICGGKGETLNAKRELTSTEKKIMESVYDLLLDNMREAWSIVINTQNKLNKIVPYYKYVRIAPFNEWIALVCLKITVGDVDGLLDFCIPYPVIEPILKK